MDRVGRLLAISLGGQGSLCSRARFPRPSQVSPPLSVSFVGVFFIKAAKFSANSSLMRKVFAQADCSGSLFVGRRVVSNRSFFFVAGEITSLRTASNYSQRDSLCCISLHLVPLGRRILAFSCFFRFQEGAHLPTSSCLSAMAPSFSSQKRRSSGF